MSMTDAQLETRFERAEAMINRLLILTQNTVSQKELRQLTTVRQRTITDLETRVASLESQLETLGNLLATLTN